MNRFSENKGYGAAIQRGIDYVRQRGLELSYGQGEREENIERLQTAVKEAEAILVGAGAGLSTAAGFTYSGERFHRYFFDFEQRFGIRDMYSGGFFPFPKEEIKWAWWARHIYFNRYIDAPRPVYRELKALLAGKDYFVLTTNVDHQFQRAGFDKDRLFYTQGDYGLFQSARPRKPVTYDNEAWVNRAMAAMGFVPDEKGVFQVPASGRLFMELPHSLIPLDPEGKPVAMNLRADSSFVEDEGWHRAAARYGAFVDAHGQGKVLYLELGVGGNTPMIIKYPFWAMTAQNPAATYACLNFEEAVCPLPLLDRSLCIDGDAAAVIHALLG